MLIDKALVCQYKWVMVDREKPGNPTAFIQYLREEQDRIDSGVTAVGDVGSEAEPPITDEKLHEILERGEKIEVFLAHFAILSPFLTPEQIASAKQEFLKLNKPR